MIPSQSNSELVMLLQFFGYFLAQGKALAFRSGVDGCKLDLIWLLGTFLQTMRLLFAHTTNDIAFQSLSEIAAKAVWSEPTGNWDNKDKISFIYYFEDVMD